MKIIIVAIVILVICVGCKNNNTTYNIERRDRAEDSLRAVMFIQSAKESGMPSYYNLDRREIIVMVDTAMMTGKIEKFANDMCMMANKHNVKAECCIVSDYKTGDTLYIYNKH